MVISENDRLLTVKEVSCMLHVHANTLRRWSDNGYINSIRISARGDRRYRKQDVTDFMNLFQPYKK